jgi:hypothetical protein
LVSVAIVNFPLLVNGKPSTSNIQRPTLSVQWVLN